MTLLEAKREIEQRIARGVPCPEKLPTRLPLGEIGEAPDAFQHRNPLPHHSDMHVRELAKAPQQGQPLEPVTIFWAGDGWVCCDGHHRLKAYRAAGWKRAVPVRVFVGTLDQALARAATNARATLQMNRAEKMRTAWRLVTATRLSRADIVRVAGVADGTVANMRRVKSELLKKEPGGDLSERTWDAARREYQGEAVTTEPDWDERTQQEAERMADILARHLGKRGQERPEALALALEMYDQRFPEFCVSHWRGSFDLTLAEGDTEGDF